MRRLAGFMLSLLLFLPACPPVSGPSPGDLHGQVDRFLHDLRWKYNDTAANKVDPEFSSAFLDQLEDMRKELNITSYAVRQVKFEEKVDKKSGAKTKVAKLKVMLRYTLLPSTVLKDDKVEQVWHEVDGRWFLVSMTGGPLPFPPPEEADAAKDKPESAKQPGEQNGQPVDLGEGQPDDEG